MSVIKKAARQKFREYCEDRAQFIRSPFSQGDIINMLNTIDALERDIEERRDLIFCVMELLNRAGWAQGSSIASGITDIIEERDQARELADFLEKKVEELREQRDLREELAARLSGRLTDCFDVYRDAGIDVSGGLMATARRVVERVQGGGE